MIESYEVTAASARDSQVFVELLDPEKNSDVWEEGAYPSAAS